MKAKLFGLTLLVAALNAVWAGAASAATPVQRVLAVPSDVPVRDTAPLNETWEGAQEMTWDMSGGFTFRTAPDIKVVPLGFTNTQGRLIGPEQVAMSIRNQFASMGWDLSTTVYAVFYDGDTAAGNCGWTNGVVAVNFLTPGSPSQCGALERFNRPRVTLVVHEQLHSFGAVPTCAPNYVWDDGQHSKDPTDIMSEGGAGLSSPKLDPDNDDYFNPNGGPIGSCSAEQNLANRLERGAYAVLKAEAGEGGTIQFGSEDCSGSCEKFLRTGTAVQLTATPDEGYRFASWDGCPSANGATCSFTLGGNAEVKANFTETPKPMVKLNIKFTGKGKVNRSGRRLSSPAPIQAGTKLTLVAVPASGWRFVRWQGVVCRRTKCSFTITKNTTLRVVFRPAKTRK